jgi:hypothetical protein
MGFIGGRAFHGGGAAFVERLYGRTFFLHVSNFSINLYGKYLCYAILAISVDLLWGYTGMLSLGQCPFLHPRRLHDGHVPHAHDRHLGQYHKPIPDFPGLPGLEHAAALSGSLSPAFHLPS